MLAEFLDIDDNINISFHIKAIDQSEAIKMVKRKNTDIDKMKIEENKKAIRSGYDMDILPSDLITYGEDVKSLLKDLQTRAEKEVQLLQMAKENARDAVQALIEPWVKQVDEEYTIKIL